MTDVASPEMKSSWLKFLLLATFAFWATGAAKHVHEVLEHHGRDASIDDDGDDDDDATVVVASLTAPPTHSSKPPAKHDCPVCQMLAAMAVDRSMAPAIPQLSTRLVDTLIVADRIAPTCQSRLIRAPRDPPAGLSSL